MRDRMPMMLAILAVLGVAIAAVLLPNSARAGGCGSPVTGEQGTTVEMQENCFTPTILRVNTGETVTWVNGDAVPHTVTGANVAWGDYAELAEGESVSHGFTSSGVYPYYCFLHPGMIGTIVVGDGGSAEVGEESSSLAVQPIEETRTSTGSASTSGGDGRGLVIGIASGVAVVVATVTGAVGYAYGRRRASR